jgi:hypothetical protein
MGLMKDLFKFNPTPWTGARCGDNWDIILPSAPEDSGVGVVATCFAGEDIARFMASAPELASALEALCRRTLEYVGERPEDDLYLECDEEMRSLAKGGLALLAKARGEQQ